MMTTAHWTRRRLRWQYLALIINFIVIATVCFLSFYGRKTIILHVWHKMLLLNPELVSSPTGDFKEKFNVFNQMRIQSCTLYPLGTSRYIWIGGHVYPWEGVFFFPGGQEMQEVWFTMYIKKSGRIVCIQHVKS